MSREWGREGYAGDWPSQKPVAVMLSLAMGVATTAAILAYQYQRQWPLVERLYLRTYLATGLAQRLGRQEGYYTFLTVVDRKAGPRLAIDGEVLPVTLANGQPGVMLTKWAAKHGAMRLEWQQGKYRNEYLYGLIHHWVFEDQSWGLAVPHFDARDPRALGSAHQSVARHAGASVDEPGKAGASPGMVRSG